MKMVKVVLENGHVEFLRFSAEVRLNTSHTDIITVEAVDSGNLLAVVVMQNVSAVMLSDGR